MKIGLNSLKKKAWKHLNVNSSEIEIDSEMYNLLLSQKKYFNEYILMDEDITGNKEKILENINICNLDVNENNVAKVNVSDCLDKNNNALFNIDIKNKDLKKEIYFINIGKTEDDLLTGIKIKARKNTKADIYIISFRNDHKKENLNLLSVEIDAEENSKINVVYVFMGKNNEYVFNKVNAKKSSNVNIKGVSFVRKESTFDFSYISDNLESESKTDFDFFTIMEENSKKTLKQTISFKKGAKGSIANEKEEVLVLGENVQNINTPILLSDEEDVIGSHGYSTSQIDDEKLFYLTSRGLKREEAIYLKGISELRRKIFLVEENEEIVKENIDIEKLEKEVL